MIELVACADEFEAIQIGFRGDIMVGGTRRHPSDRSITVWWPEMSNMAIAGPMYDRITISPRLRLNPKWPVLRAKLREALRQNNNPPSIWMEF